MAQFDANINLNVNNREALKGVTQVEGGINKLIKGVKEFERVFNDALNPKAAVQSRFQLEQERKALALFKQQNEALTNQFRLAAKLGRAYDKLQVKIVGSELVRAEKARNAQKALPGRDQKRLPAAGQTSGTQFGGEVTAAVRAEARVREAVLAEAERQLAADRRATIAKERIARAAQGEVSATTRTPGAPQPFGLLEPARGQRTTAAPVGSSGGSRYQGRLQREVDRQIRVTGKLSNELLETVAKYNKVQTSADRLVKTQGRLSTKLNKAAKTGGGGKKGGGGAGGGLAAGIGFPLLFGGGPGSVIGGAVGSAGGFGPQILLSALGGIVDSAVANIAKLGQALNPLTADIGAVTAAAGESGTAFEQLTKDLEEILGKEKALAVATAQLAVVIGQDGVEALKEFGEETTVLGNEFAKTLSQISAAVASLINNSGLLTAIAGRLESTRLVNAAETSKDPTIVGLRKERSENPTRTAAINQDIAARQRVLELAAETKIFDEASAAAAQEKARASGLEGNVLKTKIALAEAELDLTTEAGVAAAEKVITTETSVALQNAINKGLSIENVLLGETLARLQLKADAAAAVEAANRKAEAAARKAANDAKRLAREAEQARKKELRVQQTLAQLDIQKYDTAIQLIAATQGQKAALEEQKRNTDLLLQKRIQVLELSDKDARIQEKEKELLVEKNRLEIATINNKLQEITLQKKLNDLVARQQVEGVQTQLDQELSGLSLGGNDQTDLLEKQANRYANTLREVNNEIEKQKVLIANTPTPDKQATDAAVKQLDTLEKTKSAYEAMLPQIFAAEQAQLKYNQAFAAISPAVNSLVGGLREVVAGTKTAEEAFADFLNTIADQLIQTAATMIAQYLAIAAAKAIAGLSGNSPIRGVSPKSIEGAGAGMANMLIPPRATGGPVNGGQPYVVGEKGPELFIPGASGSITNNQQFEAARASMSYYGGSGGANGGTGTFRLETTVINGVEYATVEQVRAMGKSSAREGAAAGNAKTMNSLRNSRSQRSKIGLR